MTGTSALLTLLVVGALSGCAAAPDASALVGTWRDDAGIARLQLDTDGRCSADGLETEQDAVTGSCTWQIGSDTDGPRATDGAPLVQPDFPADPEAHLREVDFGLRNGRSEPSFTDLRVRLHR